MKTVDGVYQNGVIRLDHPPAGIPDNSPVLVTFLSPGVVDLQSRGITPAQADELRQQLATFADDWDSPEMDDYDDYDASRRRLEPR
jgi:hypothetical protein